MLSLCASLLMLAGGFSHALALHADGGGCECGGDSERTGDASDGDADPPDADSGSGEAGGDDGVGDGDVDGDSPDQCP